MTDVFKGRGLTLRSTGRAGSCIQFSWRRRGAPVTLLVSSHVEPNMPISGVIPQLRTTDLASSIRFYTTQLGLTLDFQYKDFYAGIRVGSQLFHLKLVDQRDPSIEFVEEGEHFHLYFDTTDVNAMASTLKQNGVHFVTDVHETPWGTREFAIKDDQGHTLYFGENRRA